jgi:hypothetical protein
LKTHADLLKTEWLSQASPKSFLDLSDIFFPHALSKNFVFEFNFGQRVSLIGDEPFAPIKTEFTFIQKLNNDARNSSNLHTIPEKEVIFFSLKLYITQFYAFIQYIYIYVRLFIFYLF